MFRSIIILLGLSFMVSWASASNQEEVKRVRAAIMRGIVNEKVNDSLLKVLKEINAPSPIMQAYLGTSLSLVAKHAWDPYTKIKYLIKSEAELKKAIAREPENLEIRFMRFSIESNCPGFIGFSKNIEADKKIIIKQLVNRQFGLVDAALAYKMTKFLFDSKRLNTSEINELKVAYLKN